MKAYLKAAGLTALIMGVCTVSAAPARWATCICLASTFVLLTLGFVSTWNGKL